MKITIIDRKDTPSIKRKGKYDEVIATAAKLSGTKTLKIDMGSEPEARAAQGSISRRGQTQKIKVEVCRRDTALFLYPIED